MTTVQTENQSDTPKRARLELRVSKEDKTLIQRAADAAGVSQTDFVLACVREQAKKTLHENEVMRLTERDRDLFVDAFLNPPEPNARLRKAAKRYLKRTNS